MNFTVGQSDSLVRLKELGERPDCYPSRNGDERIIMSLKPALWEGDFSRRNQSRNTIRKEGILVNIFRQEDVYFCCHNMADEHNGIYFHFSPE